MGNEALGQAVPWDEWEEDRKSLLKGGGAKLPPHRAPAPPPSALLELHALGPARPALQRP